MSATKSQDASSSASPCSYHVFLSFRGEDTGKTFTDHLYTNLDQAGFRTFRDDDGIEKGEDIKSELEKAIQESRISIIVFSKNYASSTWCLEELVMILKRRTLGHIVLPVFYDVDPSEVRKQIGSFKEAFTRHEEKLELETSELVKEKLKEKLGTWRAALREVADVAGMNLQNQVAGNEARFIKKIIKVVGDKLSRTNLYNAPHLVGMHSRVKNIQLWLEDGQSNVGIVTICGMGGIGKTATAQFLYNLNFSRFKRSTFLVNVREISQQVDGLLRLQRQFLTDIGMTRNVKLNNIGEGTTVIKNAIWGKKVFVVLDDVDEPSQLDAILGMRGWLFPGSKIIITTRHEQLLRAYEFSKVFRLEKLSDEESLELFSWHAFGKGVPNNGYGNVSKMVVSYCGGLPLAIKVLGSYLSGKPLNVWKTQLDKLEAIPHNQIFEKLRISYDSLPDDHDQCLFLNLACFFVGSDKDSIVTILDRCGFYTMAGIQNLVDRCLISFDKSNTLVMHHLLREMGREIIRQESPKEPGKRSILWNHKDAFNVLRENTGTSNIEGLKLDMDLLKEEIHASTVLGDNRKHHYEKFLVRPLLSILGGWLKKYGFSSNLDPTDPENSNRVAFEVDAFEKMYNLKLLQLNRVHINGPYKNFPKELRWLCWRGFALKSIPRDFPLESLVALDMQYSCLKNVWKGTKFLPLLKILNLSHSYNLAKTPDFSKLPNLERLVLKSCTSLVEVHKSIGRLERLVLLDLEDCKSLRNLPSSICMLKHLETLVISGCSNLNMESLTALLADGIVVNQSLPTNGQVNAVQSFIWPWPRLRKLVGISPLFSRAKLLHVWPGLNFWYYLAIISSPSWVFSFLAMDFIKKTTDLIFIFLISTLALSCFAINFMLSQFYFSLPTIPETDRFFREYQRAGKTIGYTLLFFGNVGLYYFTEKAVACMLTFLFLAFYCLCALFCIQPYTDFGALEFLLSACMNQTLSLFGLRSSYSCLVIIACIVVAGIRFRLEPAEVTTDEVDPAEATADEVDLESGRRLEPAEVTTDEVDPAEATTDEVDLESGRRLEPTEVTTDEVDPAEATTDEVDLESGRRLEPAEVTTDEVDPAEATTDEVDLESGHRNT